MNIQRQDGEGMTEFTIRRISAEIIEKCAKVAEARAARYKTSGGAARSDEAREIAKDIRALAVPRQQSGGGAK